MQSQTDADPAASAIPAAPARSRGRPSRISREQIIAATLDMLATEGLEAFGMARLAARMKASPMALYTYFTGRDALLDAAGETIFAQFELPAHGAGWEESIRGWLGGLEALFRRWPVALKLIKWDEHISPSWVRVWLPMVRMLHDAGLRGERLAFASSWFGNMAMSLMVGQFKQPSTAAIDSFLEAVAPQDRLLVEEMLGHAGPDRRQAIFDHGVETVIGALDRLIRGDGPGDGRPGEGPVDASLARERIRDLVARYNIAGDGDDPEAMIATFTPDALYESAIFRCVGHGEIRAWLTRARRPSAGPGPRFRHHHVTTTRIDLAGPDRATGLIYYQVMSDAGPDHCGYYRDEYRRTADGWRIARRGVWMEWVNEASRFVPERARRLLHETGRCGPAGPAGS